MLLRYPVFPLQIQPSPAKSIILSHVFWTVLSNHAESCTFFPQASSTSTVSHPSTSAVRKPTMAPVRGRKVEGRTAVTSRSSWISEAAATATTRSLQPPLRPKSTKSLEPDYTGY